MEEWMLLASTLIKELRATMNADSREKWSLGNSLPVGDPILSA